jgi:hypothetical protein
VGLRLFRYHRKTNDLRNYPSVIDQIGRFYSAHPTLVKTIGVAAIGLVMSQMTKQG